MQPYTSYPDDMLFSLLKDDNRDAFGELYDRYHKRVYSYFLTLLKIPFLSEDLVQEAFLKIWEARTNIRLHTSFSGYSQEKDPSEVLKKIAILELLNPEDINRFIKENFTDENIIQVVQLPENYRPKN